jgi:16S rRNA processing protein RimM
LKLFNEKEDVEIGRILSPHGVSGYLKVFPYSDIPERISLLQSVDIISESERRSMAIEHASVYGRFWLIKFAGIESREEAQLLGGNRVVISRDERLPLPEGHFYHDQLIGLQVYSSGGEMLGLIIDIIPTAGHDLIMIRKTGHSTSKGLIPAVKRFVRHIDLEAGSIIVDLPEGLLE